MDLYNYITEEDKKTLREWIEINKSCTIPDLKRVFRYWNKNNRTLFKLLGNQLRYKTSIDIQMNKSLFFRQLDEIYVAPYIRNWPATLKLWDDPKNEFIQDFFNYVFSLNFKKQQQNDIWYSDMLVGSSSITEHDVLHILTHFFSHTIVGDGKLTFDARFRFLDKSPLELKTNTKIMKAIQKILKYIEYPNMNLFEQWRNKISDLTTTTKIRGKLVLSIHPLDFSTLSDNECGWRSCVRMMHDDVGEYSASLTEMMNSNCAIVAYLESNHKKFIFNFNEIPNKSWRQLFYCHKDIICGGKSYPYFSKELTEQVLSIIRQLAKDNLNWNYQYGPQLYRDNHFFSQSHTRSCDLKEDKKQIIFYTYGYYNDFTADHDTEYLCVRNYIPKGKKISVSGPATCLMCGDKLVDVDTIRDCDIDSIIDVYDGGICRSCYAHACNECGRIDYNFTLYSNRWRHVCEDCLSNMGSEKDLWIKLE